MHINSQSHPVLANVIFSGNVVTGTDATMGGGGLCNIGRNPFLFNVTFSGNQAAKANAIFNLSGGVLRMANSIVWGNTVTPVLSTPGPIITYTLIEGGCPANVTCGSLITTSARFTRDPSAGVDATWSTPDDDYGDLRLQIDSPAIDAGHNALVPNDALDLDDDANTAEVLPVDRRGAPRFQDSVTPDTRHRQRHAAHRGYGSL
jgi:hypothetical protein